MNRDYYVYTLAYPDGTVFYVGKGSGYRMTQHESEALRGVQSPKCDVIRKIIATGEKILKRKVLEHLTESEALDEERKLIELYGEKHLTNIGLERRCKLEAVRVGIWLNNTLLEQVAECMNRENREYSSVFCQQYVRDICLKALDQHIGRILGPSRKEN